MTRRRPSIWNPLVCGGTPLPTPVVLMIKLIAGAILLTGEWQASLLAVTPIALGLLRALAGQQIFLPVLLRTCLIWANVLIGSAILCFPIAPSPLYGYVLLAATLLIVRWPEQMTVIYDADCGICNASRRFWQRVDFERSFEWAPFQSGAGQRWQIPIEALRERAHFIADGRVSAGFRAAKRILLYNPVTYFLMLLVIAAPPNDWFLYPQIVVPLLLLVFSRPLEPVGEAAYMWVARNRYRLSSDGACALPPKQ